MNLKSVEFLQTQINEATSTNRGVDNWLKNGKWMRKTREFLRTWLGNDFELERNGRTDMQMAHDLVHELEDMRRHNRMAICVANHYLETEQMPVDFSEPILGAMNFHTAVDNAIGAICSADDGNFHKLLDMTSPRKSSKNLKTACVK